MEILFNFLLAAPVVLWGVGGFNLMELRLELKKVVVWYLLVGGAYLIFV